VESVWSIIRRRYPQTACVQDEWVQADDPKGGEANSFQMFASARASFHNHFATDRHLIYRQTYKTNRSAALAEWQSHMA
jgi:hypothetical protein